MRTIIANFSHIDSLVFHKEKTLYGQQQMVSCLVDDFKSEAISDGRNFQVSYRVIKDLKGKPWAHRINDQAGFPPLSVTTSHSYPYIYSAATTSNMLIGCVVERVQYFEDFFLSSLLHENERSFVKKKRGHFRNHVATIIWAVKESILKALGTGLRIHPKRLDVSSILRGKENGDYSIFLDTKKISCRVITLTHKDGFIFCCVEVPVKYLAGSYS